ncbi:MAG: metal ABC transporter permease [Bacteroidota bacterium]
MWFSGCVLLIVLLLIWLGYKELYLTTFDPNYAGVVGISVGLWQALLMGAVSMTTVASFESVGAILVVAFLIAPPATAYLLTTRFRTMLWLTIGIAFVTSAAGYALAVAIDGSIAGAMATIAGILFAIAFVFGPEGGLMSKRRKQVKMDQNRVSAA